MNNFNRFDEINHTPLRIFNATVMLQSILEDFGKEKAEEYVAGFSQQDKGLMMMMYTYIKQHGEEEARKVSTRGLVLVD